jgi:hypothetical protein
MVRRQKKFLSANTFRIGWMCCVLQVGELTAGAE